MSCSDEFIKAVTSGTQDKIQRAGIVACMVNYFVMASFPAQIRDVYIAQGVKFPSTPDITSHCIQYGRERPHQNIALAEYVAKAAKDHSEKTWASFKKSFVVKSGDIEEIIESFRDLQAPTLAEFFSDPAP